METQTLRWRDLSFVHQMALIAAWSMLVAAVWFEAVVQTEVGKIGNYTFNVTEPVFVSTAVAAGIALIANVQLSRAWVITALALNVIFIVNMLRGLASDPLQSLIWLREYGSFAPLFLLAMCVPYTDGFAFHLNRSIRIAALAIALLLLIRLTVQPDFLMRQGGLEFNEFRPINKRGAVVLDIASATALAAWFNSASRGYRELLFAVFFGLCTVLSGQGTATACLLICVVVIIVFNRGVKPKSFLTFSAIMIFALPAYNIGPDLIKSTNSDYVQHRVQNLEFRQQLWQAAMKEYRGRDGLDKIIGEPTSKKTEIYPKFDFGLTKWENEYHSMYIAALSKFGIAGLVLYLFIICAAIVRLAFYIPAVPGSIYTPGLGIALLASALTLSYTYEVRNEGLLLFLIPLIILNFAKNTDQVDNVESAVGVS